MKIFVTGVDGYIGSVLASVLIGRGHTVVGLDTGFYRRGWLYSSPHDAGVFPTTLSKDLRHIAAADLTGVDVVVHLAELSNDPLGELHPEVTLAINHGASVRLAALAKQAGIPRFVYASSCSVYGAGRDGWLTETSETNPLTTYARCKVLVETDVGAMADDRFSPVFLRNATAYGASPRMRFDIVLNNLAGLARTTSRIRMTGDGTPWRPMVHVRDICHAVVCALDAPRTAVHGEIFNVGCNDQNYQVRDIAAVVGEVFTGCEVTTGSNRSDPRSYRVSFDKIHARLPGFRCEWDAQRGATELRDLFERIDLTGERFSFQAFTRLEELKYLLRTRQLDDELFWRP